MINKSDIINTVNSGESRTVEFKTAKSKINRDLYETVCAFLNRDGGEILLGVKDNGVFKVLIVIL